MAIDDIFLRRVRRCKDLLKKIKPHGKTFLREGAVLTLCFAPSMFHPNPNPLTDMRYLVTCTFVLFSLVLLAQEAPKLNTFHFSFDVFGTLPTMIEDDDRYRDRFSTGAGVVVAYRRSVSPLFSLEVGVGLQYLALCQRSRELRFGCDLPASLGGDGQTTYVDTETGISSLTVPVGMMFHLNRTRDGVYLKPSLRTNLNLNSSVSGQLHECGSKDGRDFAVNPTEIASVSFFPGLSVGYQFESDKFRTSYLEINLSTSAGELMQSRNDIAAIVFQEDAGALLGGISFGWQFGGNKKDRWPKKVQPAPVPSFYSAK